MLICLLTGGGGYPIQSLMDPLLICTPIQTWDGGTRPGMGVPPPFSRMGHIFLFLMMQIKNHTANMCEYKVSNKTSEVGVVVVLNMSWKCCVVCWLVPSEMKTKTLNQSLYCKIRPII